MDLTVLTSNSRINIVKVIKLNVWKGFHRQTIISFQMYLTMHLVVYNYKTLVHLFLHPFHLHCSVARITSECYVGTVNFDIVNHKKGMEFVLQYC